MYDTGVEIISQFGTSLGSPLNSHLNSHLGSPFDLDNYDDTHHTDDTHRTIDDCMKDDFLEMKRMIQESRNNTVEISQNKTRENYIDILREFTSILSEIDTIRNEYENTREYNDDIGKLISKLYSRCSKFYRNDLVHLVDTRVSSCEH